MAGEIWLIGGSWLRRLRGVKDQQRERAHASECAACGKSDGKLAECSTCEDVYCAGECFSIHKPRGRHAA